MNRQAGDARGTGRISVDGRHELYVERHGDGPIALVVLHGGPGISFEYLRRLEQLAGDELTRAVLRPARRRPLRPARGRRGAVARRPLRGRAGRRPRRVRARAHGAARPVVGRLPGAAVRARPPRPRPGPGALEHRRVDPAGVHRDVAAARRARPGPLHADDRGRGARRPRGPRLPGGRAGALPAPPDPRGARPRAGARGGPRRGRRARRTCTCGGRTSSSAPARCGRST